MKSGGIYLLKFYLKNQKKRLLYNSLILLIDHLLVKSILRSHTLLDTKTCVLKWMNLRQNLKIVMIYTFTENYLHILLRNVELS